LGTSNVQTVETQLCASVGPACSTLETSAVYGIYGIEHSDGQHNIWQTKPVFNYLLFKV
jgi:hypothetical protein